MKTVDRKSFSEDSLPYRFFVAIEPHNIVDGELEQTGTVCPYSVPKFSTKHPIVSLGVGTIIDDIGGSVYDVKKSYENGDYTGVDFEYAMLLKGHPVAALVDGSTPVRDCILLESIKELPHIDPYFITTCNISIRGTDLEITYSELLKRKNLTKSDIILKMDVEGAEWYILDELNDTELSHISCLIVEFHDIGTNDDEKFSKHLKVLEKLNKTHTCVDVYSQYGQVGKVIEPFYFGDDKIRCSLNFIPEQITCTYVNNGTGEWAIKESYDYFPNSRSSFETYYYDSNWCPVHFGYFNVLE